MKMICFDPDVRTRYNWCGKFESPSPEWMHLTRDLIDFELIVVTEGDLFIADSTEEYVIHKGDYVLMSPDHFQHGYKQSNCKFYWLHFWIPDDAFDVYDSESLMFLEEGTSVIPASGTLLFPERIIVLMKQLQDSDLRYHNPQLNNALSAAILLELYSQGAEYRKQNSHKHSVQIFNDITDYIGYHACENLRVSEVADYFGYNEKYLSTFFKKQAGISLKQFMMQAKMDVAKAELTDTNHSISQIAYNVGFNDTHNFTNCFKKVTGLSPSAYRESFTKRALFHV